MDNISYDQWISQLPKDWYDGNTYHPHEDYCNDLEEWAHQHPYVINHKSSPDVHINVKVYYDYELDSGKDIYNNILQIHNDILHLNITPRLIDHQILYHDDEIFIFCLITEKFGASLIDLYFKRYLSIPGPNSLIILNNEEEFDEYFPKIEVKLYQGLYNEIGLPDFVRSQVLSLVKTLLDCGWIHDDLHCGNFVQDDTGVVKIIDFDRITKVTSK